MRCRCLEMAHPPHFFGQVRQYPSNFIRERYLIPNSGVCGMRINRRLTVRNAKSVHGELFAGEFRSCTFLVKIFEICSGLGVPGEVVLETCEATLVPAPR
jgi:hypothetical protein